jgi:hypothetical protein
MLANPDDLVSRIERFPAALRRQGALAWSALLVLSVLWYGAIVVVASWISRLVTPRLPAGALLTTLTWLGIYGALVWLTRRAFIIVFSTVHDFMGARNPFARGRGLGDVVKLLRAGAPFGLVLRNFADEDTFVPTSRKELTDTLATLCLPFIVAENSRLIRQKIDLLVLSVPHSQWQPTIIELMQRATVIVIDTNAGLFHWLDDLPEDFGGWSSDVETVKRQGLVEEVERIIAKNHQDKTVVLVPPGWPAMVENHEITRQIAHERVLARKRHDGVIAIRARRATAEERANVQWFTRTRLKLALLQLPHAVTGMEELRQCVGEITAPAVATTTTRFH